MKFFNNFIRCRIPIIPEIDVAVVCIDSWDVIIGKIETDVIWSKNFIALIFGIHTSFRLNEALGSNSKFKFYSYTWFKVRGTTVVPHELQV
ncbi:hypothetical protein KBB06_01160 [Candidatus Gracilibacteria bacterium]|nr:hypothetical protein [Candidatus Gracilibacteria bacterium]